ncbi:hypothetical protein E2C01_052579 [Portunus trituberculatus]|uniref:Uncharacterized protein n=1 Tax=Portunus trituberculatus TaxID=210409 RepID=A0A5B7GI23_PORTR|nr:hypothetical protein [Portunus trituberculatus]
MCRLVQPPAPVQTSLPPALAQPLSVPDRTTPPWSESSSAEADLVLDSHDMDADEEEEWVPRTFDQVCTGRSSRYDRGGHSGEADMAVPGLRCRKLVQDVWLDVLQLHLLTDAYILSVQCLRSGRQNPTCFLVVYAYNNKVG